MSQLPWVAIYCVIFGHMCSLDLIRVYKLTSATLSARIGKNSIVRDTTTTFYFTKIRSDLQPLRDNKHTNIQSWLLILAVARDLSKQIDNESLFTYVLYEVFLANIIIKTNTK